MSERAVWPPAWLKPDAGLPRPEVGPPAEESGAAPEAVAERSAIEVEGPVGPPASIDAVGPADHLYPLIQAHRDLADRPVLTPRGPGRLWQAFGGRAGVVLDGGAKRVVFFDPSLVRVPVAEVGP